VYACGGDRGVVGIAVVLLLLLLLLLQLQAAATWRGILAACGMMEYEAAKDSLVRRYERWDVGMVYSI